MIQILLFITVFIIGWYFYKLWFTQKPEPPLWKKVFYFLVEMGKTEDDRMYVYEYDVNIGRYRSVYNSKYRF